MLLFNANLRGQSPVSPDFESVSPAAGLYQGLSVTVRAGRITPDEDVLEDADLDEVHDEGSLADALDQEGGLEVAGLSGAKSYGNISIRGASTADTLVLVNGQPVNQGFDLGSIPTQDIVRVETIRGPAALAYGPEAIGGAINIITRKDQVRPWEVGLAAGSFSEGKFDFSTQAFRFGNWSGSLSGNWFQTQGYTINTDQRSAELDHAATFTLPNDVLRLSAGYSRRFGGAPYAQSLGAAGNGQFDADDRVDQWNVTTSVSDEHRAGAWVLKPSVFYDYASILRLNPLGLDAASGVSLANLNQYFGYGGAVEASTDFRRATGPVTLGLDSREDEIDGAYDAWHTRNVSSAYASGGWFILPGLLSIDGSLRLGEYQYLGPVFTPSGTLKVHWNPYGFVYASSGDGFRAPLFDELYHPTIDYGGLFPAAYGNGEKGNPGLEPERSHTNEVGSDWKDETVTARVAGFANWTTNFISNQIDPNDGFWTTVNLPHVRVLGGEADVRWQALPWLQPYSTYTYQDVRDTGSGSLIPGQMRQKLLGGFRVLVRSTSIDLNGKLVDQNPISLPSNNLINDPGSMSPNAPDIPYWTLNVRAESVLTGNLRVHVGIENMLDAHYAVLPGIPMQGICFEAGITKDF